VLDGNVTSHNLSQKHLEFAVSQGVPVTVRIRGIDSKILPRTPHARTAEIAVKTALENHVWGSLASSMK